MTTATTYTVIVRCDHTGTVHRCADGLRSVRIDAHGSFNAHGHDDPNGTYSRGRADTACGRTVCGVIGTTTGAAVTCPACRAA